MFEHVGEAKLGEYFQRLRTLLRPGGRLLNHGISRPPGEKARLPRRSFINRYVFPDGELHEVGRVTSIVQQSGFEVRHLETLREHYALTLRRWVANLEADWDAAVEEVGEARAQVWRLYMAGSAVNFEAGRSQVHQILAVPQTDDGTSGVPSPTGVRVRVSREPVGDTQRAAHRARPGSRGSVRRLARRPRPPARVHRLPTCRVSPSRPEAVPRDEPVRSGHARRTRPASVDAGEAAAGGSAPSSRRRMARGPAGGRGAAAAQWVA